MRMALESLAARLAMENISDAAFPALLSEVEVLTDNLERLVTSGDQAWRVRSTSISTWRSIGPPARRVS